MINKLMTLFLVISALSLGGCVWDRVPKAVPVGVACSGFGVIHPDRKDTLVTKQQIFAHNTEYRRHCGAAQ